jgi:GntR family transcriptional regulator
MLEFYVETGTGVAPYAQLVQQVKQALRLGWLQPDDQLPTVQEVAASVAINANTVQKAYRELEYEGLVTGRPGQGTFVRRSLSQAPASTISTLSTRLARWVAAARGAGLDDDAITDIMRATLRAERAERIA